MSFNVSTNQNDFHPTVWTFFPLSNKIDGNSAMRSEKGGISWKRFLNPFAFSGELITPCSWLLASCSLLLAQLLLLVEPWNIWTKYNFRCQLPFLFAAKRKNLTWSWFIVVDVASSEFSLQFHIHLFLRRASNRQKDDLWEGTLRKIYGKGR